MMIVKKYSIRVFHEEVAIFTCVTVPAGVHHPTECHSPEHVAERAVENVSRKSHRVSMKSPIQPENQTDHGSSA